MNTKNPSFKDSTTKKKLDSEDIDTFRNLNSLDTTTNNNYDVGNKIINDENKHLYGNNSNLYSREYVPSKNDIDNKTAYENKRFSSNSYSNVDSSSPTSMDSVLRDSINNSTNKNKSSKKWVYSSEGKNLY